MHPAVKVIKATIQSGFILLPRHSIYPGRGLPLQRVKTGALKFADDPGPIPKNLRSPPERVAEGMGVGYFFKPAVQFRTTVRDAEAAESSSVIVLIRNRPSAATS